jgi:hypothetical protein
MDGATRSMACRPLLLWLLLLNVGLALLVGMDLGGEVVAGREVAKATAQFEQCLLLLMACC